MSGTSGSSGRLLDTQAILWTATGSRKLSAGARAAIFDGAARLLISSVTAFEYADLNRRGRFGADLPLVGVLQQLRAEVIGFPADAWRIAERLPALHSDPVDRMLVAHALDACLVIVTADALMRAYPVPTIW